MSKLITVSVELTTLQHAKHKSAKGADCIILLLEQRGISVHEKSGKIYLQINAMLNDEQDKFGNDVNVWLPQTKEEREAKEPRKFCGNGRVVWASGDSPKPSNEEPKSSGKYDNDSDDQTPDWL